MLKNEDILKLINDAQAGNNEAKTEILKHNTPLIKSIVRRYTNKQVEYEDLMQLGTLGLIKAVNNFDMSYNVKFSTYAVPMIAGEIKRFIRDDGAIKVSRSMKNMSLKFNIFIENFRQEHKKEPRVEDIAEEFKIEKEEVVVIMESSHYPISIYQENDDGLSLVDRISAKGSLDETVDKMLLKDLISKLDDRDKKIIILRYYRDKTQSEIAEELGVSQVQISRLESKIIDYMRKELV